jgi:hypothetical protein
MSALNWRDLARKLQGVAAFITFSGGRNDAAVPNSVQICWKTHEHHRHVISTPVVIEWLTSPPGEKNLPVEAPKGSTLAAQLTGLGFQLRHSGATTRVTSSGFISVDCYSFAIPPMEK